MHYELTCTKDNVIFNHRSYCDHLICKNRPFTNCSLGCVLRFSCDLYTVLPYSLISDNIKYIDCSNLTPQQLIELHSYMT